MCRQTEEEDEEGFEAQQQLLLYPLGKVYRSQGGSEKNDGRTGGACTGRRSPVSALLSTP